MAKYSIAWLPKWLSRSLFALAVASILVNGEIIRAAPEPADSTAKTGPGSSSTQEPLPLRDVVLFSSGVGYFQRSGTVEGAASIPLAFDAAHVDDILKSLLLMDPKGKVEPVTYTSQEPVSEALKAFGINVSSNLTMVDFLQQIRGVKVQISRRGVPDIVGQVLSVETHPVTRWFDDSDGNTALKRPPSTQDVSTLNLLTDTGIQSVTMDDVTDLKILDEEMARELRQSLGVLATGHDAQQKTVVLHFGDGPARTVTAGYVTETPVWKTSYRLALGKTAADKPYLQGWAIVDNSTDHDWDNIHLTLVSGQPISFIQDLYTPLYIPRPVVPPEVQANPYPQLSEEDITDRAKQAIQKADQFRAPGEGSANRREEAQRKLTVPFSVMAANPGGIVGGVPVQVEGLQEQAANFQRGSVASAATGASLGELFQYRIITPVSIPRQQSAMIPIVTEDVKADKIDLYNADVDLRNPLSGMELTNSTALHLKAGPVTVLDDGAYAGDARMPEMEPGDTEILTYAVDLGVVATKNPSNNESHVTSLSIRHGALNLTSYFEMITDYSFRSKLDKDRAILVEHPIKPDWTLKSPEKPDEKTQNFYRFRVPVPHGTTQNLKVVERQPQVQAIGLIDSDVNLLLTYGKNAAATPEIKAALADIAQRRQRISELQIKLDGQKERITTITQEQERIRQNMAQLDQNSALYKRYVAEMDDQETQLTKLRNDIDQLQVQQTGAKADLEAVIQNLNIGSPERSG